jgi:hypothetical protein
VGVVIVSRGAGWLNDSVDWRSFIGSRRKGYDRVVWRSSSESTWL